MSRINLKAPQVKGTQIQKNEWRWISLYAAALMVLLAIPYVVAFSSQTSAMRFIGGVVGIDDSNTYFAKMNQGAHGEWLFTLPYTSEPQHGAPIYWFYLLLGKVSGTDFTNRIIVFHLARSILGFILTLTLYSLIAEFLSSIYQRRLAIILITLGGGFGWLMILSGIPVLTNPPPLEFYSPEAFSFLMLLTLPHLLLARIFLFLSIQAFTHRQFLWSGLILILLCLIQPADVILVWAVISLYTLINLISTRDISYIKIWESLKPVVIAITISAPVLGYIGYLFVMDPIWNQWSTQNIIASPNPFHFVLSYGPYLILSAFGLKELKQQHSDFWRLSVAWMILIPILIYMPIGFQRRLIEGFQIPLVILTTFGLTSFTTQFQKWLIPSALTILIPSSLILITGATISVLNPAEPAFRPIDEIAIYKWLEKNARSDEILLGSYPTGNILPAYTSLTPFIGHSVETAYFKEKMALVVAFYQTETSDIERQSLIQERQIDYVFFGPHEKELGEIDPSGLPYLIKRFEQGEYSVYEVLR